MSGICAAVMSECLQYYGLLFNNTSCSPALRAATRLRRTLSQKGLCGKYFLQNFYVLYNINIYWWPNKDIQILFATFSLLCLFIITFFWKKSFYRNILIIPVM